MGDPPRIPFAVPGPSTRTNVPRAHVSGPPIITVSRQSAYNSALSDAWNIPSTSSSSSSSSQAVPASQSSSRLTPNNAIQTTCLFCPNFVNIQGGLLKETPQVIAERTKLLTNMCFHLQINANELPTNGTKFQFPFCPSCDKYIKELLKFQETLETINEKIAKHVITLERLVADKEILGSRPMLAIERQKFVRLYDMVLESYRNKLIRQRELHNSQYCQESTQNQNQSTFDPMRLRQFHGELPSSSISRNGFEPENDDNNQMIVSVDPLDFVAEVEVVEEVVNLSSSPNTNMEGEEEEEEEQSTLIISNVQSTAASLSTATSSPATTTTASSATATSSSGGGGRSQGRGSTPAAAKKERKSNKASVVAGRNNAGGAEVGNLLQIKQERVAEDDADEEELNLEQFRNNYDEKNCTLTIPNVESAGTSHSSDDQHPGPAPATAAKKVKRKGLGPAAAAEKRPPSASPAAGKSGGGPSTAGSEVGNLVKNRGSCNSSSVSRNMNKSNGNRSRKPHSSNTTTAEIAGSSHGNVTTTPINTAATRNARAVRRRGSTATAEVNDGLAKPYCCIMCNKYFSQRNHLTLHMRYHNGCRKEKSGLQQEEEGGEPIPSTSAAAAQAEQSVGAGQAVSGLTTSQPPPSDDVPVPIDTEGEELRPPPLSPQETAERAASIESSIEEVCGELGISLDGIDAGEGEQGG